MILFNKNKLLSSENNCIGVVGDNKAYTQEFYINGISDRSISYTLHLRFADGSVNSVIPDTTKIDGDVTMLRWIVKKNDIYMHGYFEVQIEGVNSTGLVFQTEIVTMYADESIPIEDENFVNLNSENLKLREEAYDMVKKLDDYKTALEGTDLTAIESTNNKVTHFESNFEDSDNKKYPTVTAVMEYLKVHYYDISDIDDMVESMHIDDQGNLCIKLPDWYNAVSGTSEVGETLVIGNVGNGGVTDEQISTAVENYLKNNPSAQNGKSAYEVALDNGFEGTETEWLASLKGDGISSIGYTLSDEDGGTNIMSINTTYGKNYVCGFRNGRKGTDGQDYILTDADKAEIADIIKTEYEAELLEILGGDENVAE